VQDLLAYAKLLVKGDSWVVTIIGLNVHDPSTATSCNRPKLLISAVAMPFRRCRSSTAKSKMYISRRARSNLSSS
jgi:hypothetical protein